MSIYDHASVLWYSARGYLVCILLIGVLGGCNKCGGDSQSIAKLARLNGSVEHNKRDKSSWDPSKVGVEFRFGDGIRTHINSTARLAITGGTSLEMEESTTIRFGASTVEDASYAINIEAGEAQIVGGRGGSNVQLDVGLARLSSNGRLRIRPQGGTLEVNVMVGSATIDSRKELITLNEGDSVIVDVGGSIVESLRPPEQDAGLEDAGIADGGLLDAGLDAGIGDTYIQAVLTGKGARAQKDPDSPWEKLTAGEMSFAPGTSVKLPRKTRLNLQRGEERAQVTGPALLSVAPSEGELLDLKKGAGTIHGTQTDVRIVVPGGVIIARRARGDGSKGDIRVRGKDTQITPRSGTLAIEGAKGGRESIGIGETATLRRAGGIEVEGRAPKVANFSLAAGENATIHDPRPPTEVRIRFGDLCSDEGVVEVSSGSFKRSTSLTRGKGSAIIRFVGSKRYRIRCITDGVLDSKVVKTGRLRVRRDSGVRPLPRKPTHNSVDADGRRYTVLYQNHLPKLTFRWPKQTRQGAYVLNIRPKRGSLTSFTVTQPRHTVGSGKLREGSYEYWFERQGTRSKTSLLTIEFDNASPTAHIRNPSVKESWGQTIEVSGAVLKGWSVSIRGQKLELDRHSRFTTSVAKPANDESIAIRFAHRKHGVHYYLRHNNVSR